MLYPSSLPLAQPKHHWENEDCFIYAPDCHVEAFMHLHYNIGMHTHSFMELNIITSGHGKHYISSPTPEHQRSCDAYPGCVFLIPAGMYHGYVDGGDLSVFHMLIHPQFLLSDAHALTLLPGYDLLCETEPYLRGHFSANRFPVLTGADFTAIREEIRCMTRYNKSGGPSLEIMRRCAAASILSKLCYAADQDPVFSNEPLVLLSDCLSFIHRHFSEKLSVECLCARANVSRSTLTRLFRRCCGQSPAAYILQYRLSKAREMELEGSYTKTEIAASCGFYDLSHYEHAKRTLLCL